MLSIGIIGLGGFAGSHHDAVLALEREGLCKLVCTCDPEPAAFEEKMGKLELEARGVQVHDHYLTMLDRHGAELDVVTIPTPVPLHAEMHRACVERGVAVYLEKPPTVNYEELNEMLEVESKAKKLTHVGFNFIIETPRQELKRRMVGGEFGKVKEVRFLGLWPRPTSYFQRASWAGRLMLDGKLVLDSCMSNAMGHFVFNTLFWAGSGDVLTWAEVTAVKAELYRAHDIEGFDTVFAKAATADGPALTVALSHACDGAGRHLETVICENATITYKTGGEYAVAWADGRTERGEAETGSLLTKNMRRYFDYVRGDEPRPLNRLVDSKSFVELCDLVYLASGRITDVPKEHVRRTELEGGRGEHVAIEGMDEIVEKFFALDRFPGEQDVPRAGAPGSASPEDLPRLRSTILQMLNRAKP